MKEIISELYLIKEASGICPGSKKAGGRLVHCSGLFCRDWHVYFLCPNEVGEGTSVAARGTYRFDEHEGLL